MYEAVVNSCTDSNYVEANTRMDGTEESKVVNLFSVLDQQDAICDVLNRWLKVIELRQEDRDLDDGDSATRDVFVQLVESLLKVAPNSARLLSLVTSEPTHLVNGIHEMMERFRNTRVLGSLDARGTE